MDDAYESINKLAQLFSTRSLDLVRVTNRFWMSAFLNNLFADFIVLERCVRISICFFCLSPINSEINLASSMLLFALVSGMSEEQNSNKLKAFEFSLSERKKPAETNFFFCSDISVLLQCVSPFDLVSAVWMSLLGMFWASIICLESTSTTDK